MHVLIVIFIISFLILIHELGHFVVALKTKTNVEEFGFGYPPRLLKLFTFKGVDFTLNAIPFGGFVRLEGEMGPDSMPESKPKNKTTPGASFDQPNAGPYYEKNAWQRSAIVLAGVAMNVLFALVAFSFVFSFMGIPTILEGQARIAHIAPDSPAEESGLPLNTNIIEIKSDTKAYEITDFFSVQQAVKENLGKTLEVTVTAQCEGVSCPQEYETYQVYARSEEEIPEGQGSIGVGFEEMVFQFYPWYEMPFRATWYGIKQAIGLGWLILQALTDMLVQLFSKGTLPQDVAGPVGIVHETQKGNIITSDFWSNLGFAGMLSLNLAIMNLLPIPALDGGKFLFILLEKVFGKKTIEKVEGYANYGGFALILILIVAITVKDIGEIIGG